VGVCGEALHQRREPRHVEKVRGWTSSRPRHPDRANPVGQS
jgi:hypothetical protein